MKRITGALAIIALLLPSLLAGTLYVNLVLANPLPAMQEKIEIISPQNTTYNSNKILLAVDVTTTYSTTLFYSVDSQAMKPIENVTIISSEDINVGKNPEMYKLIFNATAWLDLPLGEHNITVIHINQNMDWKVGQAVAVFEIDPNSDNIPEFPSWIVLVVGFVVVAVLSVIYKQQLLRCRNNEI